MKIKSIELKSGCVISNRSGSDLEGKLLNNGIYVVYCEDLNRVFSVRASEISVIGIDPDGNSLEEVAKKLSTDESEINKTVDDFIVQVF